MYWKEWNLENQTTKHYSRFRCVHGFGAVADVLCGMEYSESQTSQEIPRWQETCYRSQLKTGTVYRQKEKTEKLLIKTENTKKLRAAHLKHTYKQCSEYIYIYVSYIKPHIQKSTSLEDTHTHLNTPRITIGNLRETQRQSKPANQTKGASNTLCQRRPIVMADHCAPFRKLEMSWSWGMLSSRKPQLSTRSGKMWLNSRHAWVGYSLVSSLKMVDLTTKTRESFYSINNT